MAAASTEAPRLGHGRRPPRFSGPELWGIMIRTHKLRRHQEQRLKSDVGHDLWTRIERFHISHGFELMEASTEHAQYLNRQKWARL